MTCCILTAVPTAETSIPMLPLADGEIHLWLAFYREINDEGLYAAYRRIMNAAEIAQESRFHFADDRLRYLVTRALVRTTLSRYVRVAPDGWQFSQNEFGRPAIANSEARERRLVFNISHTKGLIVMAVAAECDVGVDTENVLARKASLAIADRFFAPDEVAALADVPIEARQQRFFEYWTFKESYIKARGMGLSIPLDKFSFRYPSERGVELITQPELSDPASRWRFWQFRPTTEHLVAVCAERARSGSELQIRKVIPMEADEVLTPAILRTSVDRAMKPPPVRHAHAHVEVNFVSSAARDPGLQDQLSLFGGDYASVATKDRLFFALQPDDEAADKSREIARRLNVKHRLNAAPFAAWRLHVSLDSFEDCVGVPPKIVRAAERIATTIRMREFRVRFDRVTTLGFPGKPSRPIVLTATEEMPELTWLVDALVRRIRGVAVTDVIPHMTLLYSGRVISDIAVEPVTWVAREFVLIHNVLGTGRPYEILGRWPLLPSV